MFRVYHTKDWNLNSKLHFPELDFKDGFTPSKKDYKPVALVNCDSVEKAFYYTNHIESEWWDHFTVTLIEKSRSTSVGDIVENTKTCELFLCMSVGWKKIEWNKKVDLTS